MNQIPPALCALDEQEKNLLFGALDSVIKFDLLPSHRRSLRVIRSKLDQQDRHLESESRRGDL